MMSSASNRVVILSGMSGTGKSCILEDARLMGCRVMRSFSKILLDSSMGDKVKLADYLLADCYMQAFHVSDFYNGNLPTDVPIVMERCILDHYIFGTFQDKIKFGSEIPDLIVEKIETYFSLITNDFKVPIYVVDIWNKDLNWIERSLKNEFRTQLVSNSCDYLHMQEKYKMSFFGILNYQDIPFTKLTLDITNVDTQWTADIRRDWIRQNILEI